MEFFLRTLILLVAYSVGVCLAQSLECIQNNTFTNNPALLGELRKNLYTIYSSTRYYDNEVFHFHWETNKLFVQSTNDLKCCITFNVTKTVVLPENYFHYRLATDSSCPVKVNEDAVIKLLYKRYIGAERCLILWTCRSSRKGVHAFCNTRTVSPLINVWIKERYAFLKVVPQPILQQVNYLNGPCFTHHRWFNIYW